MKNQITFLILFVVLNSCSLQAQVTQEWVARYNGPGNNYDASQSIVVDGSGNVYVTGPSVGSGTSSDFATIKYNSSGVQQWIQRYNGPGNGWDYARSLVIDGSENVYITGHSVGSGTSWDYATIKYNSSGVEQWVQRYNGPSNNSDAPSSLAVDGLGNVYVTGDSEGDLATIKYNSSGVQKWIRRYPSGSATSLAVDSSGNIYVTGSTYDSLKNTYYVTIKYDYSGVQQWVQGYTGTASSLGIDGSGNVIVTGTSRGSGASSDFATIKYNSSGVQQWIRRYPSGIATSLAVDSSGNVYVTGYSEYPVDYATIKYNSSGVQQWVRSYNGGGVNGDYATSLAVDDSGNVYVTGGSPSGIPYSEDYATIKYNSSGIQQWVKRYDETGNYYNRAKSVAIDGSGSVYVTGGSRINNLGNDGYDYATIKYSQLTGILQNSSSIPEKYSLSQNYPNPFNPNTNLEFGISKLGFVSLKIYNMLGKEVATLVNSNLLAGKYNYQLSTDNYQLTSGVYFYKLAVDGNVIDTKRMMLLK